jgi:hypothetical protein
MRMSEPLLGLGSAMKFGLIFETGGQIGDQPQERRPHIIFVALLVRKKPVTIVVELEFFKKSQQVQPEISVIVSGNAAAMRISSGMS